MTTPKFAVFVPTLNGSARIVRVLRSYRESTCIPWVVYILDNGCGKLKLERDILGLDIRIVVPQANLGVGQSWNIGRRLTYPLTTIFGNDDLEVGPDTFEKMLRIKEDCIITALGWSCFRQDHAVWDMLGDYDPGYRVGYCEDNDLDFRRKLAGVERVVLENECKGIKHATSSTIASMLPSERVTLQARADANMRYYESKWGGRPGQEKYTTPFNADEPCKRTRLFRKYATEPSELLDHVPTLCALARRCSHVTEFVAEWGRSSVAFLHGKPSTLVTYELRPVHGIPDGLADPDTKWSLRPYADHESGIPETDLLFIDSVHTCRTLKHELALHADKVRKWIVLHDTQTFGEKGEDGCEPGLLKAVDGLLQAGKWKIRTRNVDCNGLITLERA